MAQGVRRSVCVLFFACLSIAPLFAQETPQETPDENPFAFGLSLGIGSQSYNDPGGVVTYQSLSLSPDLAFGPFGVGLSITLNYRFNNGQFEVRALDWVPTPFTFANFLTVYLGKINYVRWGLKGEPLFIKAGSFDDAAFGNGFIMMGYSNMLFLPGIRLFGLQFDLDGALFDFPYMGIQTVVGNFAALDVLGGRLFARPLAWMDVPVLKDLQIGGTFVVDTNPALYAATTAAAAPISVFGGDVLLPIVNLPFFSLATYGDVASIEGRSIGGNIGLGGRIMGIFTYGAQARLLGPNFIPTYFGPTYDLFRAQQFDAVQQASGTTTVMGWLATLGTSFLDDRVVFNVGMDGPIGAPYPGAVRGDPEYALNYPHLQGILYLAEGIVPGFSFKFTYDKKGIGSWGDLISAENAAIQGRLDYRTGPAVISFIYLLRYDPNATGPNPWVVTSGIESSIKLF
jgi:hypothetical protein